MKIAIFGNRSINDEDMIRDVLDRFIKKLSSNHVTFLTGGATGPSKIAHEWALDNGLDSVLFKPWHFVNTALEFTPKLFYFRNKQIVDNSEVIIAFYDDSRDTETESAVKYAEKKGKEIIKATVNND